MATKTKGPPKAGAAKKAAGGGKAMATGWQSTSPVGSVCLTTFRDTSGNALITVQLPHGYGMAGDGIPLLERALEAARIAFPALAEPPPPRKVVAATATKSAPKRIRNRKPAVAPT